jgi:hypothetical protein
MSYLMPLRTAGVCISGHRTAGHEKIHAALPLCSGETIKSGELDCSGETIKSGELDFNSGVQSCLGAVQQFLRIACRI